MTHYRRGGGPTAVECPKGARNIARTEELVDVVRESGADMNRFLADFEREAARDAVLADYAEALTRDRVRAIPTIIIDGGRRLTGLVDLPTYRKALEDASG